MKQAGWKKWVILLAIYSGARRGEIVKFLKDGIKEEQGINYFELKEGKSPNAVRKIPVHEQLIKAGILNLKPVVVDAKPITDYANKLRDELKIPKNDVDDNKRVFHAFRHTFITKSVSKSNTIQLVQELVGHSKLIGQTAVYVHKISLVDLQPVVDSVIYSD